MLADRPYMRNTPSFSRWSSSATLVVLVVNLAVFILQNVNHVYVQSPIERYLALSSAGLAHGYVWQLLTFQFLHWSFWHFFINSAMLFMFGRPVEMALGRGRFFEIYFFSGAMGGLLQGLLGLVFPMPFGLPTMGASAGVIRSCVHASDRIIGMLNVGLVPGLKSVASATIAPASINFRAGA